MQATSETAQAIKAIFFDLDGTLISFNTHRIPKSAIAAIHAAKQAGYLVFAATGRHQRELAQLPGVELLPFDGMVTMGGQYASSGGKRVYAQPIHRQDIEILVDYLTHNELPCNFSEESTVFITHTPDYVLKTLKDIATTPPQLDSPQRALKSPIYQVAIFLKDGSIPPVLDLLTHSSYSHWHSDGVDLVHKDGGKWNGILHMAAHFNIQPHEIMTIGDNHNDIDMLQQAPLSVAVGDGAAAAQKAAKYVTAPVDDHGVAKALHQLLGIAACW